MRNLRHAILLASILGCTKQPGPETAPVERPVVAPAPSPGEPPAVAPQPEPPPVAPQPAPPPVGPQPAWNEVADVEMIPSCASGGGGGYGKELGFVEDAKRPIATVVLGHERFEYDIVACRADRPLVTLAAIEIPRAFATKRDLLTLRPAAGDLGRPLFIEECMHVLACDDRNGNNQCDFPGEPMLNRVNDQSAYLHASVSRRARLKLTLSSRDDRFCEYDNPYSRCCPDGYMHEIKARMCRNYRTGSDRIPSRCP